MKVKTLPCRTVLLMMIVGVALGGPEASTTATEVALSDDVIAIVNGKSIYVEDVERSLVEMHEKQEQVDRGSMDLDALVFRIVNDALLSAEARALEMDKEASTQERVQALARRLAVEKLEQTEIWAHVRPGEEMLRKEYGHYFKTVTFRMITAHEEEGAAELLAELKDGADFEALARENSKDPYSARGGLVNNVLLMDVPSEFRDELFDAEPGVLVGPVRTRLGWAVLKVDSFRDAVPESYERSRREVLDIVRAREGDVLRRKLDQTLQKAHPTTIDQEAVDAVKCERLSDGRLWSQVEDETQVMATVGEYSITAKQYSDALNSRWRGVRNMEAAIATKPLVLQGLIRKEKMLSEALRRKYDESDEVQRQARALETRLLVRRYLGAVVGANIEISEEEKRTYYEQYKESYEKPPKLHVAQITVETREQAQELVDLLRQGTDMAWLARKHSIDRFRDSGGNRGWMVPTPGLDPIQQAIFEGEPGDVLGPFGAPGNFIVMRIVARESQGLYSYEELAATAERAVYDAKFAAALDETLQALRSRSEIVINDAALAAMRISGESEKPDGSHEGGGRGH
jgi:peptidyl-prolyl cis-trans isomerase C